MGPSGMGPSGVRLFSMGLSGMRSEGPYDPHHGCNFMLTF